jgi:hypothetical protein
MYHQKINNNKAKKVTQQHKMKVEIINKEKKLMKILKKEKLVLAIVYNLIQINP